MKKIIVSFVAIAMCISLCACGGVSKDKITNSTWQTESGNALNFYKGGVGKSHTSFKWEIKDGVIVLEYTWSGNSAYDVYEYIKENDTEILVSKSTPDKKYKRIKG